MRISVTNLAAEATEDDLRTLFELFGKVASVEVQRERGRAFIDMSSNAAGREAIAGLDGQELLGFVLTVTQMGQKRGPGRGRRPRRRRRR